MTSHEGAGGGEAWGPPEGCSLGLCLGRGEDEAITGSLDSACLGSLRDRGGSTPRRLALFDASLRARADAESVLHQLARHYARAIERRRRKPFLRRFLAGEADALRTCHRFPPTPLGRSFPFGRNNRTALPDDHACFESSKGGAGGSCGSEETWEA